MYELHNDDCLNAMRKVKDHSVDLIVCDLPYGTTKCKWDIIIPFDKLWAEYKRIRKDNTAIVLFGQEPFSSYLRLSNIDEYKYDLYWQKERITNIMQVKKRFGKDVETISIFYKSQCTYNPQMVEYNGPKRGNKVKNGKLGKLIDNNNNKKVHEYIDNGLRYPTQVLKYKRDILTSNLHPTQKPIALLEMLIRTFSDEGDLVLDNTMGSGSVGVACIKTNRNFIGIEKDPDYFEIAKTRIEKYSNMG